MTIFLRYFKKENKFFYLGLLAVLLLVSANLSFIYYHSGAKSFGGFVMPGFIDDDLYYYARVEGVLHGNYMIGNPYFYEHQKDISPAFFLPDLIYALPALMFGSINYSIFFNMLFWSALLFWATYRILKIFNLSVGSGSLSAVLIFISFFTLMFRPVSSQISLTAYAFFLAVFFAWLTRPMQKTTNFALLLSVLTGVYMYQYLAQIIGATLAVAFLYFVLHRDGARIRALIYMGITIVAAMIPLVYFSLIQIHTPFYWETMYRIGLVDTNLLTPKSLYYSLLVLLAVWAVKCLEDGIGRWRFAEKTKLFFLSGMPLVIALLSNGITGKELEIASHIGGIFATYWMFLAVVILAAGLYAEKWNDIFSWRKMAAVFVVALLILVEIGPRFLSSASFDVGIFAQRERIKETQKYAALKEWLAQSGGDRGAVILAGDPASYYLAAIGRTNALFTAHGVLHIMSNEEALERYLVSGYVQDLTARQLKDDFRKYLGAGTIHRYKDHNKKVALCNLLKFAHTDCDKIKKDPVDMIGDKYFTDAYGKYTNSIKPNIDRYLQKYNIQYIIQDKKNDQIKILPPGAAEVYRDENFIIYGLGVLKRNPSDNII
jgi:hypothetical protein